MKCWGEVENFSLRAVHSVYQDFHAKHLAANIAAAFAYEAQPVVDRRTGSRRHPQQINRKQVLSRLKDSVVVLLLGARRHLRSRVRHLLEVIVRLIEPVRPGRASPRQPRKLKIQGYYLPYKRAR